uniref:Chemotaxis protein CheA n=1 Tax=candidate division WOR-3 bacterium TaxID=2052148 RepID=A0A7C4YD91_UNCW3
MFQNEQFEKYKKLFISEVNSYIEKLNVIVPELEKKHDSKTIEEIFRIFHTIKGMAATMGYEELVQVSHNVENTLQDVKDGKVKITDEIIDNIIRAVDKIESFLGKKKQNVKIVLKKDTMLPTARFFMILNRMKMLTDVSPITPSLKEIKEGKDYFEFIISVSDFSKISKLSSEFSEIESIQTIEEEKVEEEKEIKKLKELRIGIEDLDSLQNIVAELVISKERLINIAKELKNEQLSQVVETHNRFISSLQDVVMKIRMVPLSHIFDRFPRYVRDLSREMGKTVDLEITGSDIELDRSLIESISDPIIHIIRNSIDHGIEPVQERREKGKPETGKIKIIAEREKGVIKISVSDDGRGIDFGKVRKKAVELGYCSNEDEANKLSEKDLLSLLFLSGFSTKENLSTVSGRGVGLDVVRDVIRKIGGNVEIHSKKDEGTIVNLFVPLTMAIIKAYIVKVKGHNFAIPMTFLLETINLSPSNFSYILGKPVILLREEIIPVYSLSYILKLDSEKYEGIIPSLIINIEGKKYIVTVDELGESLEIVVKHLPHTIRNMREFSGTTIIGDGNPCLILDIPNIIG